MLLGVAPQSIEVLDLLGCGLAASLGNLFLGLLGLLGLGFLRNHHRLGPLFPEDAVLAVLEVQQAGAVAFKVRCLGPLAALGQDQSEATLVGGGAERAGDKRNRSWSLRALERPQDRRLTCGRVTLARAFFKCF